MCGEVADASASAGLGGVMLESADWLGGLRDRTLVAEPQQKEQVDSAVDAMIEKVKRNVFKYHGL